MSFVRLSVPLVATAVALAGAAPAGAAAQEVADLQAIASVEQSLVEAIARAEPSVVAIARVRRPLSNETFSIEFRPDAFDGSIVAPSAPEPTDPDFIPNQYGAGVVIDRRGLILTAYHVLGEDSDYYVRTLDRKVYRAWIKAADPRSDLAVLAVEAVDLTPITFGDATGLRKGQFVVALGNPHAIARDGQPSAAWGIVSNLSRKAAPVPGEGQSSGKETLHHFGTLIQTDAKLNLGASGGPLLNLRGEMVGLCVSLAATAGYETSAGYAIPVDQTFRRVVDVLKTGREVEYGFLGVQPINLDPREVLAGTQGVRVDRIVSGTPAARPGGLKPDDLITAVEGHPIHEADALVLEVGKLPVDSVVRLDVIRDGRPRTINVTLAKYPVRGRKVVTTPSPAWRGMRVDYPTAAVDSETAAPSRMVFYDDGVLVADVEQGTPAWDAGLRPGMRIGQVGRTAVRTPQQFHAAVAGQQGSVTLRMADEDDETRLRVVRPPG